MNIYYCKLNMCYCKILSQQLYLIKYNFIYIKTLIADECQHKVVHSLAIGLQLSHTYSTNFVKFSNSVLDSIIKYFRTCDLSSFSSLLLSNNNIKYGFYRSSVKINSNMHISSYIVEPVD